MTQAELDLLASNGGKLPVHNAAGWYCTFEKIDSPAGAIDRLQLPAQNYVARLEIETSTVRQNCRVPKATREVDPPFEAVTRDFPEYGSGSGTQFLVDGAEITPLSIHYF